MLNECIEGLNIKKNGIYVDGTLGGAGHSKEIARALNNTGILIGIDRDQDALNAAKENLKNYNNVKYIHGNHDDIIDILENENIDGVDGILLDLGVSSFCLDFGIDCSIISTNSFVVSISFSSLLLQILKAIFLANLSSLYS